MYEDLFDVYIDVLSDGKIVNRIAAAMSLTDAALFMRAYMEECYNDLDFSLILRHSPQGGIADGTVSAQEAD